jgi:hypothetical protein
MKKFIKELHDAFNKFKATRDGGEGSGRKGHKTNEPNHKGYKTIGQVNRELETDRYKKIMAERLNKLKNKPEKTVSQVNRELEAERVKGELASKRERSDL